MIENIFLLMGFTETASLIGDVVYWGGFFSVFGYVMASSIIEHNSALLKAKLRDEKTPEPNIGGTLFAGFVIGAAWPLYLSTIIALGVLQGGKKVQTFFKSLRKQVD